MIPLNEPSCLDLTPAELRRMDRALNALAEPGTMETYMGEASALDGLMGDIEGAPDDVRRETINAIGFEQDAEWGNR